jgi:transcriptional regulator with XRE-family HTH domain
MQPAFIVRRLRKQHNEKQSELADYLGISQSLYSNKESGKGHFTTDEIEKIRVKYNISSDEWKARVDQGPLSGVDQTETGTSADNDALRKKSELASKGKNSTADLVSVSITPDMSRKLNELHRSTDIDIEALIDRALEMGLDIIYKVQVEYFANDLDRLIDKFAEDFARSEFEEQ